MSVLNRLIEKLEEARAAATMEKAGFGFPNDRIKIESVHWEKGWKKGELVHPDQYIKQMTALYRGSWLVTPIDEALAILKCNKELIEDIEKLTKALDSLNLNLTERIKANRRF